MLICLFGKPTKKEAEILRRDRPSESRALPEEATVCGESVSQSSRQWPINYTIIIIISVCRHHPIAIEV